LLNSISQMKLEPITIRIEEASNGDIHVRVSVKHENGSSECSGIIPNVGEGRKAPLIVVEILEILTDYEQDGTLEA